MVLWEYNWQSLPSSKSVLKRFISAVVSEILDTDSQPVGKVGGHLEKYLTELFGFTMDVFFMLSLYFVSLDLILGQLTFGFIRFLITQEIIRFRLKWEHQKGGIGHWFWVCMNSFSLKNGYQIKSW